MPAGATVSGRNAQLAAKGSIAGTVTNAGGTAVGGIRVTAYSADGPVGSTTTAGDGTYRLTRLEPGGYRIGFADPTRTYAPVYLGGSVTRERATVLGLAAAQNRTGANATLIAGSHLTGTVRNRSGTVLSGIEVTAYAFDGGWQQVTTTTTSSTGAYDLRGLAARTYRLRFLDPARAYEPEYWDNEFRFERSDNIGVGAAATVSGKNADLYRRGKISGQVTNANGTVLLPGVTVTAYELFEGNWEPAGSATTSADGTYTISALKPVVHRVCFSGSPDDLYAGECWQNASSLATGTDVYVPSNGTATGIDGTLAGASRISGTITDSAATPAPLGGVQVTAYRLVNGTWEVARSTTTVAGGADTGRYTLRGLVAGTYRLRFEQPGYAVEFWKDVYSLDQATDIVLAASSSVVARNASLVGTGHITGTVTDAASAPLVGVTVTAYRLVSSASWQYDSEVDTTAGGTYDLAELTDGEYRLRFSQEGYATEYWNNKTTLDAADTIRVRFGTTVSGRNASLRSGGRITGTVTDTAGTALGSVSVEALRYLDGSWVSVRSTRTDSLGAYELSGLETANYKLRFSKDDYATEYYNDKVTLQEAAFLTVYAGARPVSGIDAALAQGGRVVGTVTDADAVPLAGVEVRAYRLVGSAWTEFNDARTDRSGRYELDALPAGTVRLGFDDGGVHTSEFWNDASSVETAGDVTVTAGGTNGSKNATLTTASRVAGRITDASGAGIPGVEVTLYQSGRSYVVGSATANGQGYYDLGGVAPDTYTLGFEDPDGAYAREYWDNQLALSSATPFSVGTLTTVTKDAGLSRASHISGTLTSTTGLPADGVSVQVYELVDSSYLLVDTVDSRDTGLFLVDGLNAGTYKLGFVDGKGRYFTQYYYQQSSLAAATAFQVAVGTQVSGKGTQLAPVP